MAQGTTFFIMNDSSKWIIELLITITGVVIGGLITIIINRKAEKERIRLQLNIDLLAKIIPALEEYSGQILELPALFIESIDIDNLKNDWKLTMKVARKLFSILDHNLLLLKDYITRIEKLHKDNLRLQLQHFNCIKKINKYGEEFDSKKIEDLLKYKEVVQLLDEYAEMFLEHHKEIMEFQTDLQNTLLYPIYKNRVNYTDRFGYKAVFSTKINDSKR